MDKKPRFGLELNQMIKRGTFKSIMEDFLKKYQGGKDTPKPIKLTKEEQEQVEEFAEGIKSAKFLAQLAGGLIKENHDKMWKYLRHRYPDMGKWTLKYDHDKGEIVFLYPDLEE